MSNAPLWARCQASILSCKVSRTLSSSRFFGPRSLMIPARPAQNASGAIPVLGAASLAMKSNRTGAIFNPWASIRFMLGFLAKSGNSALFSGKVRQQRQTAAPKHSFSAKRRLLRRPLLTLPEKERKLRRRTDRGLVDLAGDPFQHGLDEDGHQRHRGQHRRCGEGAGDIVVLVQQL